MFLLVFWIKSHLVNLVVKETTVISKQTFIFVICNDYIYRILCIKPCLIKFNQITLEYVSLVSLASQISQFSLTNWLSQGFWALKDLPIKSALFNTSDFPPVTPANLVITTPGAFKHQLPQRCDVLISRDRWDTVGPS